MVKILNVQGMSCQGCVAHVTKALKDVAGVSEVSVDLETGATRVVSDTEISTDILKEAVIASGYRVQ